MYSFAIMKEQDLIKLILPKGLLKYFEILNIKESTESYHIYLQERNIIPEGYSNNKIHSKGFYEPATIQDFPLRGKACYLVVKRRRWINIDTGDIIIRDWDVIAKGTRMTVEFATFLKESNRYISNKYP